jgi:hypothetical protein
MIADGIELAQLHERRTPNGDVVLVGFLGGAMIAVLPDPARRGTWRVTIHDPARDAHHRDHDRPQARAISAPVDAHGWYEDHSMNDDVDDEWLASQEPR